MANTDTADKISKKIRKQLKPDCKTTGSIKGKPLPPKKTWNISEAMTLFELPFNDLLFKAQSIHRQHFDPNTVQLSTLISAKTGACPEDCKYCAQSGHYKTGLEKEKLLQVSHVIAKAKAAKNAGASRFCVGAAWKNPPEKDFPYLLQMIQSIKALGLETCMTLGSLTLEQAVKLAKAGLDFYNHNLDTSPEFYPSIITTHSFSERIETLKNVRNSGMKICSGGILGMGETVQDRASLLTQLANLPKQPESVPINRLVKIPNTPLEHVQDIDDIDFVRCIAVARIMMPNSYVRLSAGRNTMSNTMQALAFHAGANSIFLGKKLLTTKNVELENDHALFKQLKIKFETQIETSTTETILATDNHPLSNPEKYDKQQSEISLFSHFYEAQLK